ncbi:YcnI family protein [Streptomyces sp. NPDC060194]|uniref:YcnI family copper-binding membrane protein n=1 Tax=Streptomyces sp. NPDC060194 TaxID=3347069 RepID=UPI0036588993
MNVSRIAVTGGVAASSLLLMAVPAFAHVSVQPVGEAAQGGYATVNVKVPNERDDASTNKLEITFPADHPLASVMPQEVPRWTAKVTKTKLDKPLELHGRKITDVVSKVTWTGGEIKPGTFQQFPLSLGQLPEDTDQLVLKAIQTYSNKEVVRWIEEPVEGGEEPESPAPVLALSPASEDGHHGAGASEKPEADAKADEAKADDAKGEDAGHDDGDHTETASAESGSDTTARVLGVVGIVIGAAGVAFGVLAGRRRTTS